jgi:tetratricopeptide (TPR) repeat protein
MYRSSWFLTAALVGTNMALAQTIAQAKTTDEIAIDARSVTVKIHLQQDESSGSGVIIHQQGDLYTLVTNSHVVCGAKLRRNQLCQSLPDPEEYSLDLYDGQKYKVNVANVKIVGDDLDLAIIQFRSSTNYPIAKLANLGSLKVNDPIYTAGFPHSGFKFYSGTTIAAVDKKIAGDLGGYTMIYSATTLSGMSGGGVFDHQGKLVAIQGRGNTSKIGSSRGISTSRLVESLGLMGLKLASSSKPPQLTTTADEYFVAGYNKFVNPGADEAAGIQQSIQDFSKAISLNPLYTFAYFRRAYAYEQLQESAKALNDYNQALQLNPKYIEAYNGRANLKGDKLNDSSGALNDYNQALVIDPSYAEAYNSRATLKADKLNDLPGALADYNQAILANPRLAEAYNGRAILKVGKLGDVAGALLDYNQAIAIMPEYGDAYYNRAVLKANKLKDLPGALADYNQAIAYDPKDVYAYNNRANVKEKINDISGSLADYNQAIAINAQYANAYFNRANLKRNRLDDRRGAIEDYREAARLYRRQGKTDDLQDALSGLQSLGVTE